MQSTEDLSKQHRRHATILCKPAYHTVQYMLLGRHQGLAPSQRDRPRQQAALAEHPSVSHTNS